MHDVRCTKPILLLQDIYSTIYLSNLVEDIILDAERELDQKEANRKHKMMINQTVSIGILKNYLIYMVKRKICYFSKYMKISVKILFPFVLIGIIPERKGN